MKISVPLSFNTINEKSLPEYCEQLKRVGCERVFICFIGSLLTSKGAIYSCPEKLSFAIGGFKKAGFEVGVWIDTLGHGRPLYSNLTDPELEKYEPILGLDGNGNPYGLCPEGDKFIEDFTAGIKKLAAFKPDIIMLDDDFRFTRGSMYFMGCFCDKHKRIFDNAVGESLPREEISRLVFSGGKNKYRDAYMDMLAKSLEDFAARLRSAVDEIDPSIRLGACSVRESIDYDGTSPEKIAKILAGQTKPFTRTSGAPYGGDVIGPLEFTRLQCEELSGSGVEIMTEGDTYPRPRYNCSYRLLLLYDLGLIASGASGGRLDYLIDYNHKPSYEMGYIDRYAKDLPIMEKLSNMFSGLTPSGIRVYNKAHKIRTWHLPESIDEATVRRLPMSAENPSENIISKCSIPTTYNNSSCPVALFGENARGIERSMLKHGAIIDCAAAKILKDAGIDTGLISAEPICPVSEQYIEADDITVDIDGGACYGMKAASSAKIESLYLSGDETFTASYSYTNSEGESFLILGADLYLAKSNKNYENCYNRVHQLLSFIERTSPLPARCEGNPGLYILASEGEGELAVLLLNVHQDDIERPIVTLRDDFSTIEFLGCSGNLSGNKVSLSEICPYGYAAFKVKK